MFILAILLIPGIAPRGLVHKMHPTWLRKKWIEYAQTAINQLPVLHAFSKQDSD
ncbi:MAG: hypothetical protein KJ725_04950 [Gammaproteobacteria bacterium]|nr:hypothetical protein [Gammaproteobacteria bacterium]